MTEKRKPKACEHEDTYPIILFLGEDHSDPWLIVECDVCGAKFPISGTDFDGETGAAA